jgi:hypothetical protein
MATVVLSKNRGRVIPERAMTSLKQIEANQLNALKSTGPRTKEGKQRSRQNALRHGLTAETVITALENAADYQVFVKHIASDYQARTTAERELVSRLASLLWRLRRSTSIETGLFQLQAELMLNRNAGTRRHRNVPLPEWYDELDVAPTIDGPSINLCDDNASEQPPDSSQTLAYCYLQISRLQYGAFDLLTRYETALWRQAAQLVFMLQSARR